MSPGGEKFFARQASKASGAFPQPVNPLPGAIRQRRRVARLCQDLGFEPSHLAG